MEEIRHVSEIKQRNRQEVFRLIAERRRISKQEIAYALQLSLPTVTRNLQELYALGVIREAGTFGSTGGRKARAIAYAADARLAIGLDVTRRHLGIVAVDLAGGIVAKERHRLIFRAEEAYYRGLAARVEAFIDSFSLAREKLLGVGIAVPALISEDEKTFTYGEILGITGRRCADFTRHIPYSCRVCHDSETAGFAEVWANGALGTVVYLSLSHSVGGAVFFDRKPYSGKNRRSGEIGHMTIAANGRRCYCGRQGCLDAYCSSSVLTETAAGGLKEFFSLLREGRPEQQRVWEEYLDHLATAIHNTAMLFDCEVVIGGYIGMYIEAYLSELQARLIARSPFQTDAHYLKVCKYRLEAIAAGAALRFVDDFIQRI